MKNKVVITPVGKALLAGTGVFVLGYFVIGVSYEVFGIDFGAGLALYAISVVAGSAAMIAGAISEEKASRDR